MIVVLRIQMHQLLKLNKAANIADHLYTMILVKDMNHQWIYINRMFASKYGVDLVNYEDIQQGLELLDPLAQAMVLPEGHEEVVKYFKYLWEPTLERYVSGTIVLKRWSDGRMVHCYYINDSTGEKLHEDIQRAYEGKLERLIESEKKATLAKNEFIANTSHEIRTPMNAIIGYSELAVDEEGVPPKTKEQLEKIMLNARWLLNIVGDIMDFSKMESGKLSLEKFPFDLIDVLEHCKSVVAPLAQSKGIKLIFQVEDLSEVMLVGDKVRLTQVMINLLSNAIKFTSRGSVTVAVEVVKKSKTHYGLKLTVRDTGIGMTQEQLSQIFEPFVQADVSTNRQYGGTGLGLAISKRIIQQMSGKFEVRSEWGLGTTFVISLDFPVLLWADYDFGQAHMKRAFLPVRPYFNQQQLLLVEDNEMNQEVMAEHLKRVGIRPVVVGSGEAAIKLVKKTMLEKGTSKPFALIFMDINLPDMDGRQVAQLIRDLGCRTPVVAMTANILDTGEDLYHHYGLWDFLSKPFTSVALWDMLLKYLMPVAYDEETQGQADESFVQKMMEDFMKEYKYLYNELMDHIDHGNITEAYTLIHNFKSNAGYLKQVELQALAQRIENNFRQQVVDEALLKEIKLALEKNLHGFAHLETAMTKMGDQPLDVDTFEGLNQLEELLSHHDMNSLNYVGVLRHLPQTEALILAIEAIDFENALSHLKQLKKELGDRRHE